MIKGRRPVLDLTGRLAGLFLIHYPLVLVSGPCSVGHQWLQSESLSDAQDANQHLPEKVGDTSFEVIVVELKT